MINQSELKDIAQLITRCRKTPLLKQKNRDKVNYEWLKSNLEKKKTIYLQTHRSKNKLTGYFGLIKFKDHFNYKGQVTYQADFDFLPGDKAAYLFVQAELKKLLTDKKKKNVLLVFAPYQKKLIKWSTTFPHVVIDSLYTVGETKIAGKILNQQYQSNLTEKLISIDPDLCFRKLQKKDIDGCLKIMYQEFRRSPLHGRGIAKRSFIQDYKKRMIKESSKKNHLMFVLEKNKKIMGDFSSWVDSDRKLGHVLRAGIGIAIDHQFHGKGLAPYLYKHLLTELKKQKINYFNGTTANPAILKLCHKLKRQTIRILVIRSKEGHPYSLFEKHI